MQLGPMIDKLYKLKEAQKLAASKATEAETKYKDFEKEVIEALRSSETPKASGKTANFSIKPSLIPTVAASDWEQFYAYIYKSKAAYLLERRPSLAACRELLDSKGVKLNADGTVLQTKSALDFTAKTGLNIFVKFTPHLTTVKEI